MSGHSKLDSQNSSTELTSPPSTSASPSSPRDRRMSTSEESVVFEREDHELEKPDPEQDLTSAILSEDLESTQACLRKISEQGLSTEDFHKIMTQGLHVATQLRQNFEISEEAESEATSDLSKIIDYLKQNLKALPKIRVLPGAIKNGDISLVRDLISDANESRCPLEEIQQSDLELAVDKKQWDILELFHRAIERKRLGFPTVWASTLDFIGSESISIELAPTATLETKKHGHRSNHHRSHHHHRSHRHQKNDTSTVIRDHQERTPSKEMEDKKTEEKGL